MTQLDGSESNFSKSKRFCLRSGAVPRPSSFSLGSKTISEIFFSCPIDGEFPNSMVWS